MAEIDNLVIRLETDDRATAGLNSLLATLQRIKSISGAASAAYSGITSNINIFNTAVRQNVTQIQQQATSISHSITQINNMGTAAQRNASRLNTLRSALNFSGAYIVLRRVSRYLAEAIQGSNEYVENLNLFNVAMGEYAGEALEYANQVKNALGIDPSEWIRAQGTFNILLTGFGVANEKAALMSKTMTQLGYDLASLYNSDVSTAMTKLQSGLAGELEPLRRWGYDLSQARLQEEALALGISKKVTEMNQAEKSMLRYHAIMTQVTEAQGDMARTLNSPANQLRIFKAQLNMLSREFGNVFIPILNRTLPYLIAFVELLREAVEKIALFFGFELPEVDYSGMSSVTSAVSDNLEDASESVKQIKRDLMGFDEINRLSDQSGKNAGSTVNNGVGFDIDTPTYDFLDGTLSNNLDEIKKKLELILPIVETIGVLFGMWKLTKFITDILTATELINALPVSTKIGITLFLAGLFIEWKGVINAFKEGLNASNFGEIVGGAILTVIGSALIGRIVPFVGASLGAAAGAIIAGIPAYAVGIYDAISKELNWMNAALIAGGATAAGAGIGAIIGSIGGPIGTGIGALIGLIVGALTDIGILVYQKWDEISAFLKPVGEWINTNIFVPVISFASGCWESIKSFFAPAFEWFSALFGSIRQTLSDIFYNIGVVASGCWEVIKLAWNEVTTWFNQNVIVPMSEEFSLAWDEVSKGASEAWEAIKLAFKPVIDFFRNTFSRAWEEVSLAFSKDGGIFTDFKESVLNAFKSIVNPLIDGINNVISKPFGYINESLSTIRNVSIMGIHPFSNLRSISVPQIPKFANGGQVDEGQLFIARERGPELVGSMNGRTTVANNEQIVEGIYRGVYAAMRDSNNGNGGFISKVVVMLDSEQVGEAVVDWHNGVVKQTGNSPLLV